MPVPMLMNLDRVFEASNCQIASDEHFVALWWTDVASASAVDKLRQAFARAKTKGRKLLFLTYLEDKALSANTPADFRQALANLLREFDVDIRTAVIVYEKPGMRGAILRGIVTTINMVSRSSFSSSVHGNLEEAVEVMLRRSGDSTFEERSVVRALRELQVRAGPKTTAGQAPPS